MFRIWGKQFKDTKMINDIVIENDKDDTRTHKVFDALDEICSHFNISRPIWLEMNIKDFKKFSIVRFNQDNFIETIDFDYLELRVIEED